MVQASARNGDVERAEYYFSRMLELHAPNTGEYNQIILCCAQGSLDRGCLYCRPAFVLSRTISSHSHWVPADKFSTQPGSLDQGCRCSRPVLVLPHCLPLRTLNEVPADQSSAQNQGSGVSVLQTSLCAPLCLSLRTLCECLQTSLVLTWFFGCSIRTDNSESQ